jgi:RNA polymerase sigma factor (sigma-70 family)
VVAFRRRVHFEGRNRDAFHRWLFGIAQVNARHAVQHHGDRALRAFDREVSREYRPVTGQFVSEGASPSQVAMAGEVSDRMACALGQLSPDQREVMRLVHEERLSLREVAERLGRSYDAVKKMHGRALLRFTNSFNRLGDSDDG